MEDIRIQRYSVLCIGDNRRYRILHIQNNVICTLQMDVTKFIFRTITINEVKTNLLSKKWTIEPPISGKIIEREKLSEKQCSKFDTRKQIMQEITKLFGPTFDSIFQSEYKPLLHAIQEKYKISYQALRRWLLKYLQSGCDASSLIDKRVIGSKKHKKYVYHRKPGPPTDGGIELNDTVMQHFAEALQNYKKGRQMTYKSAYEQMLQDHYFTKTQTADGILFQLRSDTRYPSYYQFYYYVQHHLSKQENDAIKTSKQEQRNNLRLLKSDSMKNVQGPADIVEIDAWEADVSLVSEIDREKTVGRPIVYLMIDVYSRMILAVSVSFENNSYVGLTNLFLNLADDKQKYAQRYGVTDFPEECWQSNILPNIIRVDRGADFRSDKIERMLNELGIDRKLVTPGTGSLKGVIEQEFRLMASKQNPILENHGLIEKRYDSQHHKEATLTINEYTSIVINYVIYHNSKYQDYYKMPKKMMDAHVEPYPYQLWQYGCRVFGAPRPIVNKENYLWTLMVPSKASFNRQGIKWKDLYYWTDDQDLLNQMYILQNKTEKLDIRYDPRNIGTIYYVRKNQLHTAPLNQDKFGNQGFDGMTYAEYSNYLKYTKDIRAKGKKQNLINDIAINVSNQAIVQSAKSDYYAHPEDMRKHRDQEKQLTNSKNAIQKRLDEEQHPDLKKLNDDIISEQKAPIKQDLEQKDISKESEDDKQENNQSDLEFTDFAQAIQEFNDSQFF